MCDRPAVSDIEITPAMMRAGVEAFCEFDDRYEPVESGVLRVYEAMVRVSRGEGEAFSLEHHCHSWQT